MPRGMTIASLANEADPCLSPPKLRVVTDAGLDTGTWRAGARVSGVAFQEHLLIVGHNLPLHTERGEDGQWNFRWDDESLLLQLKSGIATVREVIYIGCLREDVDVNEQDEVAARLLDEFNCVPAFLPPSVRDNFYNGFCKQYLWGLFHSMLPLSGGQIGRFDRSEWQAYIYVNRIFAEKVMEVISPEDDYVWVHDYHLLLLPTFLRRRFNKIRMGFFLHSPFPSSEIYRTLPVRDEILRSLLNADLIGFHTFDYARHFLSCCSRMLGLEYQSKRGYIGLEYYGRMVGIKIMPVGIHMGQLEASLESPDTQKLTADLQKQLAGKIVILGVDDMDVFKGLSLKILAMEQLLSQHTEWQGRVVLVQIANPARGRGKDVIEVQDEVHELVEKINKKYGSKNYQPVMLIERNTSMAERTAYYTLAECCIVTAVRDGMNLIPYEYIVCRQGMTPDIEAGSGTSETPKKSMLVISEFIGCSPSLSGAIRVNPWNIEAVAEAINVAITLPESEKHIRHEKHFKYVSTHDVAYWAQSFMGDLERTCRDHQQKNTYGIGFGLGFKVVALGRNFQKLEAEHIILAYKRSASRAILLDYDGTMIPQNSHNKDPSPQIISLLDTLTEDPKNVVFILSGREKAILSKCFEKCEKLGIAAEDGFFYRWQREEDWVTSVAVHDFEWKELVKPIMHLYTESTDIETKESALVWQYRDADPDFKSWQAKELLDHLESVLANEPVSVKGGQHTVEVKPQGVGKGFVVEQLLSTMAKRGTPPDFVLCIGDDRSAEDMFNSIEHTMAEPPYASQAKVFACTVGQKPSKAKYYLDDIMEVIMTLQALASASEQATAISRKSADISKSLRFTSSRLPIMPPPALVVDQLANLQVDNHGSQRYLFMRETLRGTPDKVQDDLNFQERAKALEHQEASEYHAGPVVETAMCTSGIVYSAEDFRREVEKGDEDGYFVSSKWLLNLEEHERENLMSVLRRAGYSETHQTPTTTLFARILNDWQNQVQDNGESRSFTNIDEDGAPEGANDLFGIGRQGLYFDKSVNIDDLCGSDNPSETSSSIYRGSRTFEDDITEEMSPVAGGQPAAIWSKSFQAALESRSQQRFYVSTKWLSNLKDKEREALEAGYEKIRETKTTTWYEKITGHVENPTGEGSRYNDSSKVSDGNDITGGAVKKSATSESGAFLWARQNSDDGDTSNNSSHLENMTETRRIQDRNSTCHAQLLSVRLCPLTSQHSMDLPAIGNRRQLLGDTIVEMPDTDGSQNISTSVERPFELMAMSFPDGECHKEVRINLKAIVSTTLCCCVKIESHQAKVRLKISRISGEVKNEELPEEEEDLCHEMVLSSLYTTVYGYMKSSTDSEIPSGQIILNLENEYCRPPRRRVLANAEQSEGDSTASADLLWLEISGTSTNSSHTGFTGLVLRGDINGRRKDEEKRKVQLAEPLLFHEPRPVIVEGDIQEYHPNSFIEFHITHKLEYSYFKLSRGRHFREEGPVWATRHDTKAVDFGCCLEMKTKGLLTQLRIKSTPI